jgi:hypothetical protein
LVHRRASGIVREREIVLGLLDHDELEAVSAYAVITFDRVGSSAEPLTFGTMQR